MKNHPLLSDPSSFDLPEGISAALLSWYDQNKRHFSFRDVNNPYYTYVSEIMLQQTRTETVEPYFDRFIMRFPDIVSLASAEEEDVLKAWEGLGYYSRARNMHKAAKIISEKFNGVFPRCYADLLSLPGIGRYTAAAICSIAYDDPVPAMDGNLTRVFSRLCDVRDDVTRSDTSERLYNTAAGSMPGIRNGDYNQALMDLGAGICTPGTPDCCSCPLFSLCKAGKNGNAELLPVKSGEKPPVHIPVAVLLIISGNRIAVTKRKENLLKDLYTFVLFENCSDPCALLSSPDSPGIRFTFLSDARHVFSHRIWDMRIYLAESEASFSCNAEWVTEAELLALPFPTAMKKPMEYAKMFLSD